MFKELTPILHNLVQKTEEEGTLLNSLCEASAIILIPKPKTLQKKKTTD